MYNDKNAGLIFPVRHGDPAGTANERTLLDAVEGSGSFRTREQRSADGNTVTRLRTKGGQPQFETETKKSSTEFLPVQKRTFVFNPYGATVGTIANRSGSGFKIVTRTLPVSHAKYTVGAATSKRNAGMWRDVWRLDSDVSYKVNGLSAIPASVAKLRSEPVPMDYGLPYFSTYGGDAIRSALFIGTAESHEVDPPGGANRVLLFGAASVKPDGAELEFVKVPTTVPRNDDYSCGLSLDDSGKYYFQWTNTKSVAPVQTWVPSYAEVTCLPGAAPVVSLNVSAEVPYANPSPSVVYSDGGNSVSEGEVGTYYTYMQYANAGFGPYNAYGTCNILWQPFRSGAQQAKWSLTTHSWSRTVDDEDHMVFYEGSRFPLELDIVVSGNESADQKSGGGGTNGDTFYINVSGSAFNWTRTTSTTVDLVAPNVGPLYTLHFTADSHIDNNHLSYPSATWPDPGYEAVTSGCINIIIPPPPPTSISDATRFNAAQGAKAATTMDAMNAAAIAASHPASPMDTEREVTFSTSDTTSRTDVMTATIHTRDYIFLDADEGISLRLQSDAVITRQATSSSGEAIDQLPYIWNIANKTDLTIKYVLDVRGTIVEFPVFEDANFPGGYIAFGRVYQAPNDTPQWEDYFSGCYIPERILPVFAPMYMEQGACPWIAYTTQAEEAAGAKPEFYIDISLLPFPSGTADLGGPGRYRETTEFAALHLGRLFTNHLGIVSPTDVWTTTLFPAPTRISYAKGIANPWQAKLGDVFAASPRTQISRI